MVSKFCSMGYLILIFIRRILPLFRTIWPFQVVSHFHSLYYHGRCHVVLVPCCTWNCVSKAISGSVDISKGPWVLFVTFEFSVRLTKITLRIGASWTPASWTACLSICDLFLTQWIMAILSQGCKPDTFESNNSRKFNKYLRPSFELCWLQIFSWIKLSWQSCSMWKKLGLHSWFWQCMCKW